jgi:hypothetical protein
MATNLVKQRLKVHSSKFPRMKWKTKVVPGELCNLPGKICECLGDDICSHLIGKISVLLRFILSPEQLPKRLSTWVMWYNSVRFGLAKSVASSSYREHRREAALGRTGCNKFLLAAISISLCNGSIARMKSNVDSGSPCRRPLAWFIGLPGEPFKRIRDDAVARRVAIQSLHLCPNPSACNVSSKKT